MIFKGFLMEFFAQYHREIFSVLAIWLMAVIMPGPDMFFVVRSSIKQSRIEALAGVGGIILGTFVWLGIGFFLINMLDKTALFDYIRLAGGGYLIYMGLRIFLPIQTNSAQDFTQIKLQKNAFLNFLFGVFTNLANPKPPIFISIILSKLPAGQMSIMVDLALLLAMLLIPSLWFYLVVRFFSIEQLLKLFLQYVKWIDLVAGLIFVLFGTNLIVEGIQAIFLS